MRETTVYKQPGPGKALRHGWLAGPLLLLAGCAGMTPPPAPALSGIDGIPCIGQIDKPPSGLVETRDPALLDKALGASGKGMLCAGKVYRAKEPVTVFRVWDSSKAYTLYGGRWSFRLPQGPRDSYRKENDICPEWSALDRMSACTLKPGAEIVVGPGQSADCAHEKLQKSATNQVYIPNDSRQGKLFVEDCTPGAPWP